MNKIRGHWKGFTVCNFLCLRKSTIIANTLEGDGQNWKLAWKKNALHTCYSKIRKILVFIKKYKLFTNTTKTFNVSFALFYFSVFLFFCFCFPFFRLSAIQLYIFTIFSFLYSKRITALGNCVQKNNRSFFCLAKF